MIWASPSFWHPRAQIPSDMGIPFQYGCRVFGIPWYPPPMPKTLVIWVSPKHASRISREIRKIFERWIPKNKHVLEYVKSQCYPIWVFTKQRKSCFKKMLRKNSSTINKRISCFTSINERIQEGRAALLLARLLQGFS